MEIQHGKGPWAPPVSGIVPLGSTLTLVVAINDYRGEFDMRVKSCMASDGGGHIIQLSDEAGCVLRPKMISRFLKARGADERASVITYAFFHAFKFPDALSVHIKCKVEICRHGCLDHCQLQPNKVIDDIGNNFDHYINPLERKDDKISSTEIKDRKSSEDLDQTLNQEQDLLYHDMVQESDEVINSDESISPIKMPLNGNLNSKNQNENHSWKKQVALDTKENSLKESAENYDTKENDDSNDMDDDDILSMEEVKIAPSPNTNMFQMSEDGNFPQGPRSFKEPLLPSPRNMKDTKSRKIKENLKPLASMKNLDVLNITTTTSTLDPLSEKNNRRRRSMVISDRKARSADVGVSGIYEVISEADLAFSPDTRAEAVTVFQGRIREEVVYGICMPVPGFSVLFVLVAVSAVVSALVAGTLLYRYQLQKEHMEAQQHQNSSIPLSIFSNWIGLKLLKPPIARPHLKRTESDMSDQNRTIDTSLSISASTSNGHTLGTRK